jgi:hypothetical protein
MVYPYPTKRLFITQRRAGSQESISMLTCLSTRFLTMGLHATILFSMEVASITEDVTRKFYYILTFKSLKLFNYKKLNFVSLMLYTVSSFF